MRDLHRRRILITGASSGIGEATARACAHAGARVACLARRGDRLAALADEIDAVPIVADIRDDERAGQAVDEAAERLGGLDGLVNNAGIIRRGSIAEGRMDDWRAMFDVNVLGLLAATQAAVPHLRGSGHADVVNVSSMSGRRVPPGPGVVYAASKFAVHALSAGMRRELRPDGIRVTIVAPGFVRTPIGEDAEAADPEEAARFAARKEAVGLEPEHVARAIAGALAEPPEVDVVEVALLSSSQEA